MGRITIRMACTRDDNNDDENKICNVITDLLVHVPAAQEAGPAAEGETTEELLDVAGTGPQLDQGGQPQH